MASLARGAFVTVDGPEGAGKTTAIGRVADLLTNSGYLVHVTEEPTRGALGEIVRNYTGTYRAHALACLVAADRYHHLTTEIRPRLDAGHLVIGERYVASSLVLQRIDGVSAHFVEEVNDQVKVPDLALMLVVDPETASRRAAVRVLPGRAHASPGSSYTEAVFFAGARERLLKGGWPVVDIDANDTPAAVAASIVSEITTRLGPSL